MLLLLLPLHRHEVLNLVFNKPTLLSSSECVQRLLLLPPFSEIHCSLKSYKGWLSVV